jgi:hypothetical protein
MTSRLRAEPLSDTVSDAIHSLQAALGAEDMALPAMFLLDADAQLRVIIGCRCRPTGDFMGASEALMDLLAIDHVSQNCTGGRFKRAEGHRSG